MPHVAADSPAVQSAPLIRAAAYARMSTDHQIYSIENQLAAIREYAALHGMTVVREYADPGRSGLDLKGRPALVQLLTDVQNGHADYEIVLVYDVSRWGRFQDTDESAYYEYICRKAKIGVVYCAEPFDNEHGGSLASIIKNIKRVMAAEYSREQSKRTARALRHVALKGFRAGGTPPYGYRRMLVAADGTKKLILDRGQRKAMSDERVALVLGPAHEQRLVRRIFRLYVQHHLTPAAIAERLNREGKPNAFGRRWHYSNVSRMLFNEVYLGTSLFSRVNSRLRGRKQRNDPRNWVRVEKAFPPIVTKAMFEAAAAELKARGYRRYTDQEALDRLALLLKKRGHLSTAIIVADKDTPDIAIYRRHFGGLLPAYARIGFTAGRHQYVNPKRTYHLHSISSSVTRRLIEAIWARGGRAHRPTYRGHTIVIDRKLTIAIAVARYLPPIIWRREKWAASSGRKLRADYTVVIRMDREDKEIMDYFFLPESQMSPQNTIIRAGNLAMREPYRCSSFTELLNRILAKAPIVSR